MGLVITGRGRYVTVCDEDGHVVTNRHESMAAAPRFVRYHAGVMSQATHILIVDDDETIRELVGDHLRRNGMRAFGAQDAAEAEQRLANERIDLIVLDLMMPGEGGLAFCLRLRAASRVPIIMLTALGEDVDRIVGLEAGADDYVAKPFTPRELIARIQAVLRRAPPPRPGETYRHPERYRFGHFVLDVDQRALQRENGEPIPLTSGEFALLLALIEHSPRVMSRDQLLDETRGAAANPFDRSIDSQISRLRRKIEADPRRPVFIKTVRNLGYAFAAWVEPVSAS
jgi:DNA-binding response OmpR family regulator